jgi:hypothetical protein
LAHWQKWLAVAVTSEMLGASASAAAVSRLVAGVLNTNYLTVTTTWNPNNKPGSVVTVQVSYTFHPLTTFVESANISLSRTAAMVISQ